MGTHRPVLELLCIRLLPNCREAPLRVRIILFVAGLPETKRKLCTLYQPQQHTKQAQVTQIYNKSIRISSVFLQIIRKTRIETLTEIEKRLNKLKCDQKQTEDGIYLQGLPSPMASHLRVI